MGYIRYNRFNEIIALTTDRNGGSSLNSYDNFNQAFHVGDNPSAVKHNREILCRELNIAPSMLITPRQMHTDGIIKVDKSMMGSGSFDFESGIADCDALYTYDNEIAIGVFHADCLPLFLYVPSRKIVGVIHAGMEGSLKAITKKAILHIIKNEQIKKEDIFVHLGPSICFYHYKIDNTLKERIVAMGDYFPRALKLINGEIMLDIPMLNLLQLNEVGIPKENITMADLCTFEDETRFYSYRRNKTTGRHISVIKLK